MSAFLRRAEIHHADHAWKTISDERKGFDIDAGFGRTSANGADPDRKINGINAEPPTADLMINQTPKAETFLTLWLR